MNVKQTLAPLSHLFSQESLIHWTGRKTIFPFYHAISDKNLPYISNLYPLRSVKEFKTDIEYFCKHFEAISIEDAYNRNRSKDKNNKPAFHLSFDDGLKEIYEVVAPILEDKGIPATFFVNTDFVDNKMLFYRYKIGLILELWRTSDGSKIWQKISEILKVESKWNGGLLLSLMQLNYNDQHIIDQIADLLGMDFDIWLSENKPYLSTDQINDLLKRGFAIGSHSVDHPRFKNIDLKHQKQQIENSLAFLENNFEIDDRIFSFPFGDEAVSAELFDWMYSEGNCKMSFGVSGIKDDYCANHIHRIPMDECHINPQQFIKTEYLYFMLKSVFNKNKIRRK